MTYDIVWMRAAEGDNEHRQGDVDAGRATLIRRHAEIDVEVPSADVLEMLIAQRFPPSSARSSSPLSSFLEVSNLCLRSRLLAQACRHT